MRTKIYHKANYNNLKLTAPKASTKETVAAFQNRHREVVFFLTEVKLQSQHVKGGTPLKVPEIIPSSMSKPDGLNL